MTERAITTTEMGALAESLPALDASWTKYDPEKAAAVCWAIVEGDTFEEACKRAGVAKNNFRYWLLRLPDLEKMWKTARRLAAAEMFDEALKQIKGLISKKSSATGTEVRAVEVAMRGLLSMAEVMSPSEFSNRQPANPPLMVKIVTTLNLEPQSGTPPTQDRGDVYTHAQKTLGTVIDVTAEPVDGQAMTPRERHSKGSARAKAGKAEVYVREVVDDTGGEGLGVGRERPASEG